MPYVPECLNRRYTILDDLIKDLINQNNENPPPDSETYNASNTVALKLMCDLWKVLKENPDCDITQVIRDNMELNTVRSSLNTTVSRLNTLSPKESVFKSPKYDCYMAETPGNMEGKNSREIFDRVKRACCQDSQQSEANNKCCSSKSVTPSAAGSDALPLSKVLCNLKEAASFDRKCNAKLGQLLETEKHLVSQITHLEHREKEGMVLLKQADCMWTCMEEAYKKKIYECLNRQKDIMDKLAEIEKSASKWRKNKQDLDIQMSSIYKCNNEITDKINLKNNDLKYTNAEIESLKKKIETVKKETESVKKSFSTKQQASDKKIQNIVSRTKKLEKELSQEKKRKMQKEKEGEALIKDARDDLTNIGKILLQKQLETQDLKSDILSANIEIDIVRESLDNCQSRCNKKRQNITEELAKVAKEIGQFKVKCIQCHQCSSTVDIRKFCTDCPRCAQIRDCLYNKDKCYLDHAEDCICMSVKHKFLDNVFENMYTVLERQIKTGPGKAVGDAVLQCLKRSINGKIDSPTRNILQQFILTTIRKNLNLTIVGGAIKTRCELDPDAYKQLMLCLKQVKVTTISKSDKGTGSKKAPCRRWGGTNECNCPKGPGECLCTIKGPKPSHAPRSSPPTPPDKEDPVITCPHKDGTPCGADCAAHTASENQPSGSNAPPWKPSPCKDKSCTYIKNVRAAQCVFDKNNLTARATGPDMSTGESSPIVSNSVADVEMCVCKNEFSSRCPYHKDLKQLKVLSVTETVVNLKNNDLLQTHKDITNCLSTSNQSKELCRYFKVKTNLRKYNAPDYVAMIAETPSENFNVILDKEFEKIFRYKIDDAMGENKSCFISLDRTKSASYLINFENISIDLTSNDTAEYALLIKSSSGLIKILKDGNIVDESEVPLIKNAVTFNDDLLSHQKINEQKIDKETLVSNIYSEHSMPKKIKIVIQDYRQNDVETSGLLRKVAFNYVIQFDGVNDKKLQRIKTFLYVYKVCYIPIKMNNLKETIAILLDKERIVSCNETYGLLKATFSGNIFLIVDETTMTQMEKSAAQTVSYHIIQPVSSPNNKSVNTSCNARSAVSDNGFCNKEKCACSSLPDEVKKCWLSEQQFLELKLKSSDDSRRANCSSFRQSDQGVRSVCGTKRKQKEHVVYVSCNKSDNSKRHFKYSNYKSSVKSVCDANIALSGNLSGDENFSSISAISVDDDSKSKYSEIITSNGSDSLFNLPIQLPHFLRNANEYVIF